MLLCDVYCRYKLKNLGSGCYPDFRHAAIDASCCGLEVVAHAD